MFQLFCIMKQQWNHVLLGKKVFLTFIKIVKYISSKHKINNLAKDKSITIVPVDKGRSIVLNTADYKKKANVLLSDESIYQKLDKDPISKFLNKLLPQLNELKQESILDERNYRKINPTSTTIHRFYGLPKVQKQDVPLQLKNQM